MIEFKNVVKKYPNGTLAIHELNLSVEDGEALFIYGKTDSGKTTLRKLMLLEERVTSGDIIFDGIPLSKIRTRNICRHRRKIGVLFRESRLFTHRTLYDNFVFVLRALDCRRNVLKERAKELLTLAGLWDKAKTYPEMLTPLERKKAEIARCLASNPKTVIADEPTASLDTAGGLEILNMLMKLNRMGRTVIIFTKDEDTAKQFGKRMITLDLGEVVEDNSDKEKHEEKAEMLFEETVLVETDKSEKSEDITQTEETSDGTAEDKKSEESESDTEKGDGNEKAENTDTLYEDISTKYDRILGRIEPAVFSDSLKGVKIEPSQISEKQ